MGMAKLFKEWLLPIESNFLKLSKLGCIMSVLLTNTRSHQTRQEHAPHAPRPVFNNHSHLTQANPPGAHAITFIPPSSADSSTHFPEPATSLKTDPISSPAHSPDPMMEPPPPPPPQTEPPPSFPTLPLLDPATPHPFAQPAKRINEGADVDAFLTSRAYRNIGLFIMQLNRAMCPRRVPGPGRREAARTWTLDALSERELPASVRGVRGLVKRAGEAVDEAPPDLGPRRFGNVSFRKWWEILEGRVDALLDEFVSREVLEFKTEGVDEKGEVVGARDELRAYLLGAFGSSQRLDYGTGHELSFLAFLGCLWKLGAFKDGKPGGEIERQIVLGILEP